VGRRHLRGLRQLGCASEWKRGARCGGAEAFAGIEAAGLCIGVEERSEQGAAGVRAGWGRVGEEACSAFAGLSLHLLLPPLFRPLASALLVPTLKLMLTCPNLSVVFGPFAHPGLQGYGIVRFTDQETARRAVLKWNEQDLEGRRLAVVSGGECIGRRVGWVPAVKMRSDQVLLPGWVRPAVGSANAPPHPPQSLCARSLSTSLREQPAGSAADGARATQGQAATQAAG
jgi:hypothetical protein